MQHLLGQQRDGPESLLHCDVQSHNKSGFILRGAYDEARLMKLNNAKHHQARAEAEDWLDSLGCEEEKRRKKRAVRNAPAPKTAKRQKKSRA